MNGPSHLNEVLDVMPQGSAPLGGAVHVSDMITPDTGIEEDGSVVGTIKYINSFPEFSNNPEEQKGNFFPIHLDDKYSGKPITVKRNGGETSKTEEDLDWILRIPNKDAAYTFEADSAQIMQLNFKKATIKTNVGGDAVAIAKQSEDMDAVKPASTLIDSNVAIEWTGIQGKVTGNVHWYKFTNGHFAKKPTGHYVPVVITGHDGETIVATGSDEQTQELDDPKWIIRVDDFITNEKPAKLAASGVELAELDFKDVVLELPTGENAFDKTKTDYGQFGNTTAMYKDGKLTASWNGTKCTVTGTLNKIKKDTFTKLSADGYYFAFRLIEPEFTDKSVTVQLANTKTNQATDWVMTVTEESKAKPLIIKVGEQFIAEFDISGLTLAEEESE